MHAKKAGSAPGATVKTICLWLMAVILLLAGALPATAAEHGEGFADGSGTYNDPFVIVNAEQLNLVREYVGGVHYYFRLEADIDLSGFDNWEPIGSEEAAFIGDFDGNGHVIKNLTISDSISGLSSYGLFGYTGEGTLIKNLQLEDVSIDLRVHEDTIDNNNDMHIGALAGFIETSDVSNIVVQDVKVSVVNAVYGQHASGQIGALVGVAAYGSVISNIYLDGVDIYADDDVENSEFAGQAGALAGATSSAMISYVQAQGNIFVNDNNGPRSYAGGLVGGFGYSSLDKAISHVSVISNGIATGGLIGYLNNNGVLRAKAYGDVQGSENVGGLIGMVIEGNIEQVYAYGQVQGQHNVGGLIGSLDSPVINQARAYGDVSGESYVGGLIGLASDYRYIEDAVAFGDYIVRTSGEEVSFGKISGTSMEPEMISDSVRANPDMVLLDLNESIFEGDGYHGMLAPDMAGISTELDTYMVALYNTGHHFIPDNDRFVLVPEGQVHQTIITVYTKDPHARIVPGDNRLLELPHIESPNETQFLLQLDDNEHTASIFFKVFAEDGKQFQDYQVAYYDSTNTLFRHEFERVLNLPLDQKADIRHVVRYARNFDEVIVPLVDDYIRLLLATIEPIHDLAP